MCVCVCVCLCIYVYIHTECKFHEKYNLVYFVYCCIQNIGKCPAKECSINICPKHKEMTNFKVWSWGSVAEVEGKASEVKEGSGVISSMY